MRADCECRFVVVEVTCDGSAAPSTWTLFSVKSSFESRRSEGMRFFKDFSLVIPFWRSVALTYYGLVSVGNSVRRRMVRYDFYNFLSIQQ